MKQTRQLIKRRKLRTCKGGSVFGFSRKKDTTDILHLFTLKSNVAMRI